MITALTGLALIRSWGHQGVDFLQAHPLADRALHANQADAVLVFDQLAHGAHAAVAQVVDVVDLAAAVFEVEQVEDDGHDVLFGEGHRGFVGVQAEFVVHLHAADLGQVVAFGVEKQVVEQLLGGFQRRRIAGTQALVNLDHRFLLRADLVLHQRFAQRLADGQRFGAQDIDGVDFGLGQLFDHFLVDLLRRFEDDFAGLLVDHVIGRVFADQVLGAHAEFFHVGVAHPAQVLAFDARAAARDDFVFVVAQIHREHLVFQPARLGFEHDVLAVDARGDFLEILAVVFDENLVVGVTQRLEQHRGRHLAFAVDAHVQDVFGVELEIDPRPAVGDDAGVVQQFARAVRFALVVVEKHAGAAVQLADDDALGAVDDERPVFGHQRNLAEVDFLFLDVANRLGAAFLVHVPDDQADGDLERRGEIQPALFAFLDVVFGLFQRVLHELQTAHVVVVVDREDALEHALQADVLTMLVIGQGLQKPLVRLLLDVDQIRNVDDLLDRGIRLAVALDFAEGRVHPRSPFRVRGRCESPDLNS